MSAIDTKELIEHLNSRWGNRPCPMCTSAKWNVPDKVYELREFNQGNLTIGLGTIVPVIPVVCESCGFTAIVNAILSKQVEQPSGETK